MPAAITAIQECDGGTCIQSLNIEPPTLAESACAPTSPTVPMDNPLNLTIARTCGGAAIGTCDGANLVCTPTQPTIVTGQTSGFWTYCIHRDGADDDYTMTCPSANPNKYVLAGDYHDTRACSSCTCGPPTGGECSYLVAAYADDDCTAEEELGAAKVSSDGSMCLNLLPGSPLVSMAAINPTYKPGVCQPGGGGSTGGVEYVGPVTFCCQN